MNKVRLLIIVMFCALVTAAGSSAVVAQPELRVEPSYEVPLQLLVGSNDGSQKAEFPKELNNISQRLKNSYAFGSYRLAGTFLGRISNTGNYEYKSLGSFIGKESGANPQTFLEWSISSLRNGLTAKGPAGFQAQGFNFGARVPVTVGTIKDETGKERPQVSYERIGLSLSRISLPDSVPTLIGTLNLPGASDTVFLVMTVKSVDL